MARKSFFEIVHLGARNIAGNVATVFIALVIKVRPGGTFADDAESAAVHPLDLSGGLEDGFRSGFWIHYSKYVRKTYTSTTKKGEDESQEEICHAPSKPGIRKFRTQQRGSFANFLDHLDQILQEADAADADSDFVSGFQSKMVGWDYTGPR